MTRNYFESNAYRYQLRANRLFFNMDWHVFPKPGVNLVPAGFTMSVNTDSEDNVTGFCFTTRMYGYESSSNNGVRSYSDLDDYWDGDDSLITPELKAAAIEYLKKKDTEFYGTMIMNKIKHVIAGDWKLELHKSGLTKEDLLPLADAGETDAQILLLFGMTHNAVSRTWFEDFVDEETGIVTKVERYSVGNVPFFSASLDEIAARADVILSSETYKHMLSLVRMCSRSIARAGELSENKELAEGFYWKALEAGWQVSLFTDAMDDLMTRDL